MKLEYFSLFILIPTGILRLNYEIPKYITIKIISVIITLFTLFFIKTNYDDVNYQKIFSLRVLFVMLTALIGILI
ncbi:MAG: hypothetical protein OEY49_12580 [Candidatus Heimdallarchaeota archaeon]|nr:hypothetical protein [Candidatus Heimdallarchaeota archaeon]